MFYSTGLTRPVRTTLLELVADDIRTHGTPRPIPPMLALSDAMLIALRGLRTNHTQVEIAEASGCSRPTVSREVTALTGVLARVLAGFVPVAEEVDCAPAS